MAWVYILWFSAFIRLILYVLLVCYVRREWDELKRLRLQGIDIRPGELMLKHIIYSFLLGLIAKLSVIIYSGEGFNLLTMVVGYHGIDYLSGVLNYSMAAMPLILFFFLIIHLSSRARLKKEPLSNNLPLPVVPPSDNILFFIGLAMLLIPGIPYFKSWIYTIVVTFGLL